MTTGTWTDVNALDFTAPIESGAPGALDGNAAANRTSISSTITGLSVANGATFWIRWNDLDATGADDGLAIDDFCITANGPPQTPAAITNGPPPSPVIVGTPYSFTFTATGNPSPTFSLTGTIPDGLTLSSNGLLSGTATSGGTGNYPGIMVIATNGVAPAATQTFSLTTATVVQNYLAGFGLTGNNAVLSFDYDGDGLTNLLEYALGLNPTLAGLDGLPVVTIKDYGGTAYLSMIFNRSSLASDVTYVVQGSSDLANWDDLGISTAGGATAGSGFIGETGSAPNFAVEVRDTVPYDPSMMTRRFIRLKVTSP